MSLAFLTPSAHAVARSPMEREALAAGARIERRDGWNVAVAFDGAEGERGVCRATVGFADRSALGKIEIQAGAGELAAIVAVASRGEPLELGAGRNGLAFHRAASQGADGGRQELERHERSTAPSGS